MIQLPEERRPPISPSMALRVAVLGGLALVLFAIVFFRLWYLEVLSGDQYVVQANENQVREVRIQAPRGDIVDRYGRPIVRNRMANTVQIEPARLPAAGAPRRRLYRRLGGVLEMSPREIQQTVIEQRKALPYANVTVKQDVSLSAMNYIKERQPRFPGVTVEPVFLRRYPYGPLAAQLLGYVGRITRTELKQERYKGVHPQAVVGQAGLEWEYDRYLRGRDGATLLSINSLGKSRGFLRRREPLPGRSLKLSLDLGLQQAGQLALARAGHGNPGGFVALDPRNGQVLALGSVPSFNPTVFAKPLLQSTYRALTSKATGAPLFNRAIAGAYPTGSTFKPITAVAGLSAGVITPFTVINDGGCLTVGLTRFCSPGNVGHGAVALSRAIQVSSDVYFYTVGRDLDPIKGEPLQRWARKLGLGQRPPIDLTGAAAGYLPVPGPYFEKESGTPWYEGQTVNLAIGQGALQVSPLQLAVAYSAIVNGGTVVRPHLGEAVIRNGVRRVLPFKPVRRLKLSPYTWAIKQGLYGAANNPSGTSFSVFSGFPIKVAGKTGTAEAATAANSADHSWYASWAPYDHPKLVVVAMIEHGGFGAEAAAPTVKRIYEAYFHLKPS